MSAGSQRAERPLRYRDAGHRDRRRFRLVAVIVAILVLAGLLVVGDMALRAYADERVASEIESRLPENVDGDVRVRIGGTSVILQYLTGRFDEVRLGSDNLTVDGIPVEADVELTGVPVDTAKTVDGATGRLSLTEDAVGSLLAAQGVDGDISLTGGNLAYRTETEVLGQTISLEFAATPAIDAGRIVFTPQEASISAGGVDVGLDALIPVLEPDALSICVAQYLPPTIELGSVLVGDGQAVVNLTAKDLPLTESALSATGTC
jgi:hypothetical protein